MTSSCSNNQPTPKPSLWLRFRHHLVHPDLTPECVAWSFAIGLSLAWNPILGLHTFAAIACCYLVRNLHRPLLLLATFLNNPWTLAPIASTNACFGNLLLGNGWTINISGASWNSLGIHSFTSRQGFNAMYSMLKPILIPYLLGGIIVSFLAIPTGYCFMLWLSRKLRKKHFRARTVDENGRQ